MQELTKQLQDLRQQIQAAVQAINLDKLTLELEQARTASQKSDFWNDSASAQAIMKQASSLEKRVSIWQSLQKTCDDLLEMVSFDDASMQADLLSQYEQLKEQFEVIKDELKFSGAFDANDAIIDIYAGAGGTDAQDWAEMLMRMYIRWAEAHDYVVHTISISHGEEAGIKSATLEIGGDFVYGKLRSEHGVHRLVRLSPFNSDNLRQTSFAKIDVLPKIDQPEQVELDEKDLKIDVLVNEPSPIFHGLASTLQPGS